MTRNPVINALSALAYIAGLVSIIFYAGDILEHSVEDSIFTPIAFLSLFVFSAATMGYIFLGQPIQMFLEGEKKGAVDLFLKTLLSFAGAAAATVTVGLYINSIF
ncbi:MAG: hypothetical protein V4436_03945 [Patescibacteria group bacterium]